jgi:hypothetical protein
MGNETRPRLSHRIASLEGDLRPWALPVSTDRVDLRSSGHLFAGGLMLIRTMQGCGSRGVESAPPLSRRRSPTWRRRRGRCTSPRCSRRSRWWRPCRSARYGGGRARSSRWRIMTRRPRCPSIAPCGRPTMSRPDAWPGWRVELRSIDRLAIGWNTTPEAGQRRLIAQRHCQDLPKGAISRRRDLPDRVIGRSRHTAVRDRPTKRSVVCIAMEQDGACEPACRSRASVRP